MPPRLPARLGRQYVGYAQDSPGTLNMPKEIKRLRSLGNFRRLPGLQWGMGQEGPQAPSSALTRTALL